MSMADMIRALRASGVSEDKILDAVVLMDEERKAKTRARVAKHRNSKRSGNVTSVTSVTDVTEKEVSPHTPLQEKPIPPSPPKGGSSPTAGRRLPDDFEPDMQAATAEGLSMPEAQREADKFRDYWRSQAGQRGRKADWPATWRNWCRRAGEDRAKARGSPSKPKPKSVGDMFADQARQMMNGYHDEPANKTDRHITQGNADRHDRRVGDLVNASLKSGW